MLEIVRCHYVQFREDHLNPKILIALLAGAGIGAIAIEALHAQSRPPAYVITEFEVTDKAALTEFSEKVAEAVKASGASISSAADGSFRLMAKRQNGSSCRSLKI
jgi:hypothetical protein